MAKNRYFPLTRGIALTTVYAVTCYTVIINAKTNLAKVTRRNHVRRKHSLFYSEQFFATRLPKVFWEEGRVAALSHTYPVKSPLVTMARPKFAPKSTISRGPIPKPHYMPHPWTSPTYDAKRHLDPIRRLSTMHWTDQSTHVRTHRQTDRPTDHSRESLTTIGRCAPRATRPKMILK